MPEVADIFRLHAPAYRQRFGQNLLPSHRKALEDIEHCRTPYFGGHVYSCLHCGREHYSYHSCQNRHCPKCQGERTERWLQQMRSRMLPCPYFLITPTLPKELRSLARSHQKVVYSILMQSAGAAIQELALDPRYLGATPAIMAVLHTWTRAMAYHLHVHFLVSAGGLDPNGRWVDAKRSRFLFPAPALSPIFRAKFCDGLRRRRLLQYAPAKVWKKNWVVDCKHAGNGETVLSYLARYIHRIAISNSRIDAIDNGQVTFHYRQNKTHQLKYVTIPGQDFIARFLQHVLPRGFTKVRYYGLWSPSSAAKLEEARAQLPPAPPPPPPQPVTIPGGDSAETTRAAATQDFSTTCHLCPFCHQGPLLLLRLVPRRARSP
jgi:hypothetical protein